MVFECQKLCRGSLERRPPPLLRSVQQRAEEKLFSVFESFDSHMDRLNHMPGIVRRLQSWRTISRQKKNHYGQVVPIEDIERIFEFVNSLVRINCICRYATLRSEQRYCYAVSMVPDGGQMGEMIRQSNFLNGPGSMGLEMLAKEEALAAFRDHQKESLCHACQFGAINYSAALRKAFINPANATGVVSAAPTAPRAPSGCRTGAVWP